MKRIYLLLIVIFTMFFLTTGCVKKDNMQNINIITSSYPTEFLVDSLYGDNSKVENIFPDGETIDEYEFNEKQYKMYSSKDLFVYNGSNASDIALELSNRNKELLLIDSTKGMKKIYGTEELWLDPSKLLTVANNIRKGFNEYTEAKYLKNDVNKRYEDLKVDLTNLEAKYRESVKYADNKTIIVSDDIFLFLKNYGANVISLDSDNPEYEKNIASARNLVYSGQVRHIYLKEGENNDIINSLIEGTNVEKINIYTLSTITDEQRNNYDYISLMTENLEKLKKELYN